DGDGIVDRLDECPELAAGPNGRRGCPTAYVKGDEIVILDQVHFATDKDIILPESNPILEEVAKVLVDHPEIREVRIEGHTDVRATDAYNMNLSQRRVDSVAKYLTVNAGIDPTRLNPKGFGHTAPVYDDAGCLGPDEGLSATCKMMTSKNRRVVFRIVHRGAPPPRPITGADSSGSVLPTKEGVLPSDSGVLSNKSALPPKAVLPSSVLPEAGSNPGLPQSTKALPDKGVLPQQGTPKKAEEPAPPPAPAPIPPSPAPKPPTPIKSQAPAKPP